MIDTVADTSALRLPDATRMGVVDLKVSNLPEVLAFYTEGVGLEPMAEAGGVITLGLAGAPVLTLTHSPELRLPSRRDAGLFHTAILFPSGRDLARSMYSTMRRYQHLYQGAGDHIVSEAFYFSDPEGNGVELYVDRPRDTWTWNDGRVTMDTLALDAAQFLRTHLDPDDLGTGAPTGLAGTVGHVHLQVGDVETARRFYVDALGFDETHGYPGSALFVSAGGYHHHMAMNTWNSRGAGPRHSTLGLGRVDIVLPGADDVETVRSRLTERGIRSDHDGAALLVRDPWENLIRLSVG